MSEAPREPLSWLVLERYALGEISGDERRAVEARLSVSLEDRRCLDAIRSDMSELPELPVLVLQPKRTSRGGPVTLFAGLAAAAAALIVVGTGLRSFVPTPARRIEASVKGGEVAMALVSDRQGREPRQFTDGERFKVIVTCPPDFGERLRLLILQGGQRYEPLPRAQPFVCGNQVPWEGAFTLDGASAVEVCLAWGVAATRARAVTELGDMAVCTRLVRR